MSLKRRDFTLEEGEAFDAFLKETPQAIVLFRGSRCPYSAAFRPHFHRYEGVETAFATNEIAQTTGPEWVTRAIRVTPTVVAYRNGLEVERVEARPLVGMHRVKFDRWVAALMERGWK